MPARKGLLAPQNTFLDTIATRFDGTHSNFVLGNAKIATAYPIVYCSDGFCELTCYSRAYIMQKSCACNFLYGPKTDVHHKEEISRALEAREELKLEVILYKHKGPPFWCLLDIVPIQDEKHEVVLFLCSYKDITKQKLHAQQKQQLLQQQQQQQHLLNSADLPGLHPTSQLMTPQTQHDPTNQHQNQQQQQHHQALTPQQQDQHQANTLNQHNDTAASADSEFKAQTEQQQHDHEQSNDEQQNKQLVAANASAANDQFDSAFQNNNALMSFEEFGPLDGGDDEFGDEGEDSEDQDKHTASQYSRRRSRAVLYQLSGHYGKGGMRNVNMKAKLKLNNRMNIPEYKTTTIEKQRFILSHYGVGKSCWDWLILIVSFYVAIVVPYNATFKEKRAAGGQSQCQIDPIDIFVEAVFVIDVVLNFRTTFVNRKGEVVTQPKTICRHYIRGWFVVDACAALPFDFLCGLNIYKEARLNFVDLNLLKLIRLLRLARLLQKMDRYSQYSYIILTLLMLIFSLLAHWCACIWYVIAMEEIQRNPNWKIGWINQLGDKLGYSLVNGTDMASSYVTALYFTTSSLTSVGFGNVSANTNAEKIFSIVIMLIGALMHAVVFGNVTALIRVMYARRSNYQTRLRDLKDFFRLHQLPKELQQRMSDYFQTTWSLNHGIETYEILKDFPEELRGDVSLHLHREVLALPIFETAPQGFLKSLARHIESKFCCPTEYLIHRGDALSYLYLVCNGSMEVLQDNMVVAILGKGDLVGYDVNAIVTPEHTQYGLSKAAAMLGGPMGFVKSSSDLKALTYCDLKCIHISGLLDVLKLYPEFSDTFHREIIHDLSFNLRENHDVIPEDDMDGEEGHDDGEQHVSGNQIQHSPLAPVSGGVNSANGDHGDVDDDDEDDDNRCDDDDDDNNNGSDDEDDDDDDNNDDSGLRNRIQQRGRRGTTRRTGSVRAINGCGAASNASRPRAARRLSSPPPLTTNQTNLGHLYRSITRSGDNQIGRYDHEVNEDADDDEPADDEDDDDDEEEEEEVDDEEDDEEGTDEEDEDDDDDNKGARFDGNNNNNNNNDNNGDPDGRAGGGNDSNNNNNNTDPGNKSSDNRPPNDSSNDSVNGNLRKANQSSKNDETQRDGDEEVVLDEDDENWRQAKGAAALTRDSFSDHTLKDSSTTTILSPPIIQQTSTARRNNAKSNDSDSNHFNEEILRQHPRHPSSKQRLAETDWQSSQSYDGIIDMRRRRKIVENQKNVIKKNNSDDTILEHKSTCSPLRQYVSNNLGAPPQSSSLFSEQRIGNKQMLRSALGRTNSSSTKATTTTSGNKTQSRKPPLSFDLSRNTTAIVDRRRRSAGCIPRPLLIGNITGTTYVDSITSCQANSGSSIVTRVSKNTRHSSSLIHINEDQPMREYYHLDNHLEDGHDYATNVHYRDDTASLIQVTKSASNNNTTTNNGNNTNHHQSNQSKSKIGNTKRIVLEREQQQQQVSEFANKLKSGSSFKRPLSKINSTNRIVCDKNINNNKLEISLEGPFEEPSRAIDTTAIVSKTKTTATTQAISSNATQFSTNISSKLAASGNKTNDKIQDIDARISGISSSLCEMKQEFVLFRDTMNSLIKMVEASSNNSKNNNQSSSNKNKQQKSGKQQQQQWEKNRQVSQQQHHQQQQHSNSTSNLFSGRQSINKKCVQSSSSSSSVVCPTPPPPLSPVPFVASHSRPLCLPPSAQETVHLSSQSCNKEVGDKRYYQERGDTTKKTTAKMATMTKKETKLRQSEAIPTESERQRRQQQQQQQVDNEEKLVEHSGETCTSSCSQRQTNNSYSQLNENNTTTTDNDLVVGKRQRNSKQKGELNKILPSPPPPLPPSHYLPPLSLQPRSQSTNNLQECASITNNTSLSLLGGSNLPSASHQVGSVSIPRSSSSSNSNLNCGESSSSGSSGSSVLNPTKSNSSNTTTDRSSGLALISSSKFTCSPLPLSSVSHRSVHETGNYSVSSGSGGGGTRVALKYQIASTPDNSSILESSASISSERRQPKQQQIQTILETKTRKGVHPNDDDCCEESDLVLLENSSSKFGNCYQEQDNEHSSSLLANNNTASASASALTSATQQQDCNKSRDKQLAASFSLSSLVSASNSKSSSSSSSTTQTIDSKNHARFIKNKANATLTSTATTRLESNEQSSKAETSPNISQLLQHENEAQKLYLQNQQLILLQQSNTDVVDSTRLANFNRSTAHEALPIVDGNVSNQQVSVLTSAAAAAAAVVNLNNCNTNQTTDRPVSQNSSLPPATLLTHLQSNSGVNLSYTTINQQTNNCNNNNNSDNDSGRSSSSVNSFSVNSSSINLTPTNNSFGSSSGSSNISCSSNKGYAELVHQQQQIRSSNVIQPAPSRQLIVQSDNTKSHSRAYQTVDDLSGGERQRSTFSSSTIVAPESLNEVNTNQQQAKVPPNDDATLTSKSLITAKKGINLEANKTDSNHLKFGRQAKMILTTGTTNEHSNLEKGYILDVGGTDINLSNNNEQ